VADIHTLDRGTCPACGERMTEFGGGPEPPRPGDFSICAYCRVYLVIEANAVRLLSHAEWRAHSAAERAMHAHVREAMPRLQSETTRDS
jgi:hypothetical protein